MLFKVPVTRRHVNRPAMASVHDMITDRFRGLGYCDDSGNCTDDDGSTDTGTTITIPTGATTSTPIVTTSTSDPGTSTDPNFGTCTGSGCSTSTDPNFGTCTGSGCSTTLPSTQTKASLTSAGLTAAQAASILSTAGQAAIKAYNSTQSPGLIPGTNLIYNPATGQITNAAGGILSSTGVSALGSSTGLLVLLGLGLAVLVIVEHK